MTPLTHPAKKNDQVDSEIEDMVKEKIINITHLARMSVRFDAGSDSLDLLILKALTSLCEAFKNSFINNK